MTVVVKVRGLNREEDIKELRGRIGLKGQILSDSIIYSDVEDWSLMEERVRSASQRLPSFVVSLYNSGSMELRVYKGGVPFTRGDAVVLVDELISNSSFSVLHGVFDTRAILTCKLPTGELLTVFSDAKTKEEREDSCIEQVEEILLERYTS